jgi:hypothetical protein
MGGYAGFSSILQRDQSIAYLKEVLKSPLS